MGILMEIQNKCVKNNGHWYNGKKENTSGQKKSQCLELENVCYVPN